MLNQLTLTSCKCLTTKFVLCTHRRYTIHKKTLQKATTSIGGNTITKKLTHDEFVDKVFNLVGDEYSVLGTYTLSKNKVKIVHNLCGNYWDVKANNFISGARCPKCMAQVKTKTTNEFRLELKNSSKGNYELLSEYISHDKEVNVLCNLHKTKFTSTPTKLLRNNSGCPLCYRDRQRKSQTKHVSLVDAELLTKHKGTIKRLGDYINTHTPIDFKCTTCGTVFTAEPNSVTRVSGCPRCNISKGEQMIVDVLNEHNIKYVPQYSFEGCVYKRALYYDFYLPEHNILVEFDGEQHFRPIDYFGGIEAYNEQIERDTIKNNYAMDNGITLIRFSYTDTLDNIRDTIKQNTGVATM